MGRRWDDRAFPRPFVPYVLDLLSVSPCLRGDSSQGPLGGDRAGEGVRGAREGDQERVARFFDLVAAVMLELLAEQRVVPLQRHFEVVAGALVEGGRALDVREEEGHRAGGKSGSV